MKNIIKHIFTNHPGEINESYWQHMRYALSFSLRLMVASVCAFIHAFLPILFQKTASTIVYRCYEILNQRFKK